MNGSTEKTYGVFWPLASLALALLIVLVWQFILIRQQGQILTLQMAQRNSQVQGAQNVQTDLERLVRDLLALAKTNEKAQALVIRENPAPAAGKP
jgi:hypothetical protein